MDEEGKRRARAALEKTPAKALATLRQAMERQYDEVKEDIVSVRSRAGSLLTGVGLVFATLALVSPVSGAFRSLAEHQKVAATIFGVVLGVLLLALIYLSLGVLWLSLRAQQVGFWGQADMHPEEAEKFELEYVISLFVTHQDNVARLANPVGYLRQAQGYFLVLLLVLMTLIVVAVSAIAFDITADSTSISSPSSPSQRVSSQPSPRVSKQPSPTISLAPTPPSHTP